MENLKIKVNNEAESGEAQALLLKMGYKLERLNKYEYPQYVAFNPADMTFKNYVMDAYVPLLWKEITLQELRDKVVLKRNDVNDATHTDQDGWKWYVGADSYVWQAGNAQQLKQWDKSELKHVDLKPIQESKMTTPQHKEYLDPHNNYELIEWDGGFMVQEHWIEVPMGAEILSSFNNGQSLIFHKQDLNYVVGDDEDWNKLGVSYEYFRSHFPLAVILWQRNAGKEYLDPVDNYKLITAVSPMPHWIEVPKGAEILADTWVGLIFYKEKDCESFEFSHAGNCEWSLTPTNPYNEEGFIGALVWQRDTQPNQTTTDAMNADADSANELFASASLESTLAERQSTYGDFRDVANTTGQLMGILRNSKNGHTLPYMHEEALHMICSKMARLVNGDPAHKDSWHDIAGYAKLMEDSL